MTTPLPVRINRVRPSELPLPAYATALSAGMDLRADITDSITLGPMERQLVPTGIALELPEGYEAQVRPRSGLALKQGITCLNSPGTIDADYRGEVSVLLANFSNQVATIRRGDRIAQLVVARVGRVSWVEADSLSSTTRGAGGFGSTGS